MSKSWICWFEAAESTIGIWHNIPVFFQVPKISNSENVIVTDQEMDHNGHLVRMFFRPIWCFGLQCVCPFIDVLLVGVCAGPSWMWACGPNSILGQPAEWQFISVIISACLLKNSTLPFSLGSLGHHEISRYGLRMDDMGVSENYGKPHFIPYHPLSHHHNQWGFPLSHEYNYH